MSCAVAFPPPPPSTHTPRVLLSAGLALRVARGVAVPAAAAAAPPRRLEEGVEVSVPGGKGVAETLVEEEKEGEGEGLPDALPPPPPLAEALGV